MRLYLCLTIVLAAPAIAQDPATVAIERAVGAYSKVRTAHATFEQSIINPLTGSKLHSKGEFDQARPDKFAFRFSDPKGDVIVSDGRFVWIYLPSSTPGQVIRAPLSSDIEGSIDLIGTFFTNPRSKYVISDGGTATVGERATRLLTLVPKTKEASFTRARVWIDSEDGTLRQFEAQEHSGITRTVRIVSFTPNADVAPSAFAFKPAKGIRVVDQASMK
jgi:outer membrane lipoprotein carrier protein